MKERLTKRREHAIEKIVKFNKKIAKVKASFSKINKEISELKKEMDLLDELSEDFIKYACEKFEVKESDVKTIIE